MHPNWEPIYYSICQLACRVNHTLPLLVISKSHCRLSMITADFLDCWCLFLLIRFSLFHVCKNLSTRKKNGKSGGKNYYDSLPLYNCDVIDRFRSADHCPTRLNCCLGYILMLFKSPYKNDKIYVGILKALCS